MTLSIVSLMGMIVDFDVFLIVLDGVFVLDFLDDFVFVRCSGFT